MIQYAPLTLRSAGNGLDTAMFQTFVVLIGIIDFVFILRGVGFNTLMAMLMAFLAWRYLPEAKGKDTRGNW